MFVRSFFLKLDIWSALLGLYIAVFVRQYFWPLPFASAWIMTLLITAILTLFFVFYARDERDRWIKIDWAFWLVVGLPATFFYFIRLPFPDYSFDIINYHFISAERALRGFPLIEGDFFYLIYSNPAGDMLTGIYRHALGHRLGTVVNLLAFLWAASVLNRILTHFIPHSWTRAVLVLFVLSMEGILYQISNYWVDILAFPLLLEAFYLLFFSQKKTKQRYWIAAALLGMSLGLKLTNLYLLIPLIPICLFVFFKEQKGWNRKNGLILAGAMIAFLLPLIPYHSYMFIETGNPIYPHLNNIFESPYFSTDYSKDLTLGYETFLDRLIWPAVLLFNIDRLSPLPMFPALTTLGYFAGLGVLIAVIGFKRRFDLKIIIMASLVFVSTSIWGFVSGDFRYVTFFEVLSSLLLVMLSVQWLPTLQQAKKKLFIGFILTICSGKFVLSMAYFSQNEWAGRPTIFQQPEVFIQEAKHLLRDRHLFNYLSEADKHIIDQVEVWLPSSSLVSGYMSLLRPRVPYVDLHHLPMRGEKGEVTFRNIVEAQKNKRFFSLIKVGTLGQTLEWSLDEIRKLDFELVSIRKITVPFYSDLHHQNEFILAEAMLASNREKMIQSYGEKEFLWLNKSLIVPSFGAGFYSPEASGGTKWRWSMQNSSLELINYSANKVQVTLQFNLTLGHSELAELQITSPTSNKKLQIKNGAALVKESFILEPNSSLPLRFQTNAKSVDAPGDSRSLFMQFLNFSVDVSSS